LHASGPETVSYVLNHLENRLIFLKHGVEKPEHLLAVEDLADAIKSMKKLGV
jgi:hypothetical protein